MKSIKIGACAKLNLSLNIEGKRHDGYHLLSSVMQSVNFKNHLSIQKGSYFSFGCNDVLLPTDTQNTAVMATKLFFEKIGTEPLVNMELQKMIPYGAGMGSASADAAAALFGLNMLYDEPLTDFEILELGLKVGADVPFAFSGGTKLVEGIGEKLSILPNMPHCWFVIATPDYKMPTVLAYRELDNQGLTKVSDNGLLIDAIKKGNLECVSQNLGNVFFTVSNYEKNSEFKNKLLNLGALNANLTGSGSSVYGIFDDYDKACYAKKQFERAYICEPCNKSIIIE